MRITVQKAADLIRSGTPVAIPTETVYGLAADAFNIESVQKTFTLKGRPPDNPLIVHIADPDQLDKLAVRPPAELFKLAENFWPGPLTFVLEKHPAVPDIVTGGLSTVAVRMPDHPLALDLIRRCGPLTAPSANQSGRPSPTKAAHVEEDFGDTFPVIDGGECDIGLESTVLDLTTKPYTILRPGAVSAGMIENCMDQKINDSGRSSFKGTPKSPGVKYTHYKPKARVFWIEKLPSHPSPDTLYLLHSQIPDTSGHNIIFYSGNFQFMARQLYDRFRYADHQGYAQIAIEKLPGPEYNFLIPPLYNRISKAING
jgi:L-threonylcarbamoyladenylate synthase